MTKNLSLKKGLDIKIMGEAPIDSPPCVIEAKTCAVVPDDFTGLTPKAVVAQGDIVKKGSPIIIDKHYSDITLVAPIAGTVREIVRGERRKILRVVIDANESNETLKFDTNHLNDTTKAQQLLMQSGLWAEIRQRPYDIVPNAVATPRDIFVTAFDSAPLAPNYDYILNNVYDELCEGVKLLKMLTTGNVYVATRPNSTIPSIPEAIMVQVEGRHPAGNAGIQAANIAPVNKGETIWTLDAITLRRIGHLIITGEVDTSTIVAITGSEVTVPQYCKTIQGIEISPLIKGIINLNKNLRIISGNVLTGKAITADDYLRFPYSQVTIIPEGNDVSEFMGWASMSPRKMSVNRSFPGHFLFKKRFSPDARILGSRRAMIMSGEYDKVLPMDIYAEYLLKAIISRNIDQMEALGIYEVAPEDFALCEYVDTSKLEIQQIVREGLDYMRKELE